MNGYKSPKTTRESSPPPFSHCNFHFLSHCNFCCIFCSLPCFLSVSAKCLWSILPSHSRFHKELSFSLLSLRCPIPDAVNTLKRACSRRFSYRNVDGRFAIQASKEDDIGSIPNVIFEPFEEVKQKLHVVPTKPQASLARQQYSEQCEDALNEQINVEYSISYAYHATYAYFDRDNIALKGLAKFFKDSSLEERQHAEKLMEYQNKRGGRVKLKSLLMPLSDYDHKEKGDALEAMELALSLEKLNNKKLLNLHKLANENGDAQLADFIESEFLADQVKSIRKISEYVARLRRVGKGHGVWHFDQVLLKEAVAA